MLHRFGIVAAVALCVGTASTVSAEDGTAAFQKRQDVMKQLGRPFYLGVGKAVKGLTPLGPDTVAAAETVATLAKSLDPTLFPPGSDVSPSKVKPEIFAQKERVSELGDAVRKAADNLVVAVKGGDKAAITAAYAATNDACNACHRDFRKSDD
jgi:cytochrome c556